MGDSKKDRRAIRTKRMIKGALSELLEEKNFNDITIIDLTTRADINRGTFYLHYIDKFDMLEKIENEIIAELQEHITKNELSTYLSYYSEKPAPFMIKLYEYFKDNSKFIKAILGPNGDKTFQTKLKKYIELNLFNMTKDFIVKDMLVPKEYFISYIVSAHLGVIQQWLENGTKESPGEMASILSKLFLLGPYKATNIKAQKS